MRPKEVARLELQLAQQMLPVYAAVCRGKLNLRESKSALGRNESGWPTERELFKTAGRSWNCETQGNWIIFM